MRKLIDGEEIQIGDCIIHRTCFGDSKYIVHRLTPKYAFVKYNDVAEGKFAKIYNSFGFGCLPRPTWNTTTWEIYRPEKT